MKRVIKCGRVERGKPRKEYGGDNDLIEVREPSWRMSYIDGDVDIGRFYIFRRKDERR